MSKVGRSPKDNSFERLRIELCFKDEIEENNIFMAASIAYFFVVLFACLRGEVETYFGIILILTATMIIWYFKDKRTEIRKKYEREIDVILSRRSK